MNRTDMAFLEDMFRHYDLHTLQVLVINQTTPDRLLHSSSENIRVLNSFEKGLSKSRNLALTHAQGDICLLADDDTCFVEGFDAIIKQSFETYHNAALLTFRIKTFEGLPFRTYSHKPKMAKSRRDIAHLCSIEIAFRRHTLAHKGISFNELFGLNSPFPMAEEYLFAREVLQTGLPIYYIPREIVEHSQTSSTSNYGNYQALYTQGALSYIDHRHTRIFYLLKLVLLLAKKRFIKWYEVFSKLSAALKGARDYKKLINQPAA